MTEHPESLAEAVEDHDITLAMTPGQLVLAVIGIWLLLRFIRGLRS
ncbi:MAG TPA: hypothetical protein VLA59_01705 [Patescibacteria group bacterium]|nr:hypothetical protein [Patescibacteria group bacterium]